MGRSRGSEIIDIVLVEEGGKHVKNPVSFPILGAPKKMRNVAKQPQVTKKKHGQKVGAVLKLFITVYYSASHSNDLLAASNITKLKTGGSNNNKRSCDCPLRWRG